MPPEDAYKKILLAVVGQYKKEDRWSRRLHKKYTKKKFVRVPEYEIYLNRDPYYAFEYCKTILKNKLPTFMHNKMICLYLINNDVAKKYFEYVKKLDSPSLL